MSVSFFVEAGETTAYRISCMCQDVEGKSFDNYYDASLHLMIMQEKNETLYGCSDKFCSDNGLFIDHVHDAFDTAVINMSNKNAKDVLNHLGIDVDEEDWAGSFDPHDLMARIDIALAIAPDSVEIDTVQNNNMIICGREEGYIQKRLQQIISVCEDAVKLNRKIVWG